MLSSKRIKRLADIILIMLASPLVLPVSLAVALLIKATSPGPVLYWSDRVGWRNQLFRMPKFRTMQLDTPIVATHLLSQPETYLTPVGGFLRRTSLDELPQLWSVLRGEMSLVGPRPALFNQTDLIELRTAKGIDACLPGLTGWAQINGRDELPIPVKVAYDQDYLERQSLHFDLLILWRTVLRVIRKDGVSH